MTRVTGRRRNTRRRAALVFQGHKTDSDPPAASQPAPCRAGTIHKGSKALCIPENITLLLLPPWAPELNPVENVRAHLRAKRLAICLSWPLNISRKLLRRSQKTIRSDAP